MSKRTIENIQEDFNKLGSELLQVEIGVERLKEALTRANSDRNRLTQKLLALDNEFQSMKYSELKITEKKDDSSNQETGNAPSSPSSDQASAG